MRLEQTVLISRPIEDVWAFFADIENLPRWDRGVARVQVTSGDGGVGSTFDTFAARERGRMSYEVTKLEPPYENEAVTRSGQFKLARWHFGFAARPEGTAVTCISEFWLRWEYLWLRPVFALIGEKAIRADLAELKRVLEGGS